MNLFGPPFRPVCLRRSPQEVCYSRFEQGRSVADFSRNRPCQRRVEKLFERLWRGGPFVAMGPVGPHVYHDKPQERREGFALGKVYSWTPKAKRRKRQYSYPIFILGVEKGSKQVYFTLAQALARLSSCFIFYAPSQEDERIFVMSYGAFRSCVVSDRYKEERCTQRISPVNRELCVTLLPFQERCVKMLCAISLDSLREEEGYKRCVALGQYIFRRYEEESGIASARDTLRRICDAVPFFCEKEGEKRRSYVARAWREIG